MMKKTLSNLFSFSLYLVSLGTLATQTAIAGVSGNIGATTNYLWRGVSQTGDAVAIQGGLDYSHEAGFYLGTWLSNVDFGDDTSYEMDFYAGYSGQITDELGFDISYLYYAYPDTRNDIDFGELSLSLNWQWLSLGYSHTVNGGDDIASSPLEHDDMGYLQANASWPIADTLTLDFHYGYSSGDIIASWFGRDNYSDYSVSLAKDTGIGSVSFAIADTDLPQDDAKVFLSYLYTFDL